MIRKIISITFVLSVGILFFIPAWGDNEVFQYSTLTALMSGQYDGDFTIEQLLRRGNFGLGTFNNLAGEMIVLDGQVFQVDANGQATIAPPGTKTPFAVVTHFRPRWQLKLDTNTNFVMLSNFLDEHFHGSGRIQIIRVDGHFTNMKLRTVPTQHTPYRPLAEIITQSQLIHEYKGVSGTLVGFRFPQSAMSINVPGHHLHFLSEDRKFGGHVLDFLLADGQGVVDESISLQIFLPAMDGQITSKAQYESQIQAVEKGH